MRAGYGAREITPSCETPMAGFDRRKMWSSGVLDPLYVSVLALVDERELPFLFCVFDLLGIDRVLCGAVKQAVGSAYKIPQERIWVSATHTHSAPSRHFSGKETYRQAYVDFLIQQTVAATTEAMENLELVVPEIDLCTVVGVASLRNQGRSGAAFPMPMLVTRLVGREKTYCITRIACHPTVLDERNTQFSSDLPGQIRACLGKQRPGIVLNGACADISTRFTRNGSDPMELRRLGEILGKAVLDASCTIYSDFGRQISAAGKTTCLSRAASLSGTQRDNLLSDLRKMVNGCEDPQILREYDARIAVLERAAVAEETDRKINVSAVDFGPYILLGLPFEVDYVDGRALEQEMSAVAGKQVYLVCYSGGYDGYLPSGAPLTANSSYEDFASRYLPESREQIRECAKQCVMEVKETV